MNIKLPEIKVGKRHRDDLGDIDGLAASIKDLGLLHPIVVNDSWELIAGERRYRAAERLGWKEIPATIAKTLDDVAKALRAERDENRCRKDFSPAEAVAMARALEPFEKSAATERMKAGKPPEKFSEGGKANDKIAEAVGMSTPTLTKAKAVVKAAESHPETYGTIATEMNRTGKVAPAYEKLAEKAAEPKAPAVALPIKPARHKPSGGEVWCKWVAECQRVLNDTRDAGGIEALIQSWAPGEQEEYLEMLCGFRDAAQGWITYLEKRCAKRKRVG